MDLHQVEEDEDGLDSLFHNCFIFFGLAILAGTSFSIITKNLGTGLVPGGDSHRQTPSGQTSQFCQVPP
jgi:hypothetical protein